MTTKDRRMARNAGQSRSNKKLKVNQNLIRLLEELFNDYNSERKRKTQKRLEFIVHMTDWIENLDELYLAFKHPSRKSSKKYLESFLVHALPHLISASRILRRADPCRFLDKSELQ